MGCVGGHTLALGRCGAAAVGSRRGAGATQRPSARAPQRPLWPTLPAARILDGRRWGIPLGRDGPTVGRRGIKEYRAGEALTLIAQDREGKALVCPSCGAAKVARTPKRGGKGHDQEAGRISLHCDACGRNASYLARTDLPPPERTPVPKH